MIYDCFMFSDELDTLEMRLKILDDVVDKFVIVEGTRTQNNKEKKLIFDLNKERYSRWSSRLVHIVVDEWPEYENQWTYEHYQRNCILRGLKECKDSDVIIICDVDEIPNPNAIRKAIKILGRKDEILNIKMYRYMFFYNYLCYTEPYWFSHPKIFKYGQFKKKHSSFSSDYGQDGFGVATTPDQIRCLQEYSKSVWGGWHFSTVGDKEAIQKTISTLAVADEYFESGNWEIESIKRALENGFVPNRPQYRLCSVKSDYLLPDEVLDNWDIHLNKGTVTSLNEIRFITYIVLLANIWKCRCMEILRIVKNKPRRSKP